MLSNYRKLFSVVLGLTYRPKASNRDRNRLQKGEKLPLDYCELLLD